MSEDRLRAVEQNQERIIVLLESLTAKVEGRIADTDQWRNRVERTLLGDGNGQKGHNVRLDRLEQTAERQKWMFRTVFASLVGLVLEVASAYF